MKESWHFANIMHNAHYLDVVNTATDDKYDSVFCLQKHPAKSLPRLNNVSALNQSLEARTEADDGIQDLDNIKIVGNNIITSLAIVQYEYKNDEMTSQQCEYNKNIISFTFQTDNISIQRIVIDIFSS